MKREGWTKPEGSAGNHAWLPFEADVMHALLVLRADRLSRCVAGSEDPSELEMISDAIQAYEAIRWPGRKG